MLLAAVERLRERCPSSPSCSQARARLRASWPRAARRQHRVLLPGVDAVAQAYDAIDPASSRRATKAGHGRCSSRWRPVPLVSTRVGQAADLVRHGENGWLVDVEDVDGLVHWSAYVREAADDELAAVRAAARATAEQNSYPALRPRWKELLRGFVDLPEPA